MRLLVSLTIAALFATAALAAEPPPAPAAPETPVTGVTVTAVPEDPVICRKSPETGSRVRASKECRKRSEWAAKSKSRSRAGETFKMGDCGGGGGGGGAGCELTPLPPGN